MVITSVAAPQKSSKGLIAIAVFLSLFSALAAGTCYWLFIELENTEQNLEQTASDLSLKRDEITSLSQQVSGLETSKSTLEEDLREMTSKFEGLKTENTGLRSQLSATKNDLEEQKVISDCSTGIIGALALAESETQLYTLLIPYEEVCSEAATYL
jgi:septal ring factor EnvC (AmiA/AmiB activator)